MKQEIKINVNLSLEADLEQTKREMENFVRNIFAKADNSKQLSLNSFHINRISEEAEIYAPDPDRDENVWKFIEKHYLNFSCCKEIMRNDDLCKIVNGELEGDAENLFRDEFKNDFEAATAAFDQSIKYVYERAIVGYQRSQQGRISIVWGLQDVEDRAKDNGYLLKEGQAQQVLDMLKDKHDCSIGITWDVIDDYLSCIVPET